MEMWVKQMEKKRISKYRAILQNVNKQRKSMKKAEEVLN